MARKKGVGSSGLARLPADYGPFLDALKQRVQQAQTKAMLSVNRELIQLYWDIGRLIVERQEQAGWGQSVLERLAGDLQKALPGVSGFSRSNVFRMRAFVLAYRTSEIVAQPVRQIRERTKVAQPVREMVETEPPASAALLPWGHNVVLFEKIKDRDQRLWYAAKALEHGWSRAVLTVQIEQDLYHRQGKAVTNFTARLPAPQSDLAHIGLILCKTRNRTTAEYALRDIAKPIGVAEWQTKIVHSLPERLKGSLPSIEEIEAEFGRGDAS